MSVFANLLRGFEKCKLSLRDSVWCLDGMFWKHSCQPSFRKEKNRVKTTLKKLPGRSESPPTAATATCRTVLTDRGAVLQPRHGNHKWWAMEAPYCEGGVFEHVEVFWTRAAEQEEGEMHQMPPQHQIFRILWIHPCYVVSPGKRASHSQAHKIKSFHWHQEVQRQAVRDSYISCKSIGPRNSSWG